MHGEQQLRFLFGLIPDGRLFRRWCERTGIDSLQQFLEVDLSDAPESLAGTWKHIQAAIREADRVSRQDGVTAGRAALDKLLRKPPSRLRADPMALVRLTPVERVEARRTRKLSAREALVQLGGVAGARAVAELLTQSGGQEVTVRQVRDRFRNTGGTVRKLGAGYFATRQKRLPPVLHWVEARLNEKGQEPLNDLVAAILEAYPQGDERAIYAWIHQQPGVLNVRDNVVYFVEGAKVVVEEY